MNTELISEREVTGRYRLSIPWLRRARREGRGPKYVKLARMVRYRPRDIETYLVAHTVETADAVKATGGHRRVSATPGRL
jgi:predicted DNA-binding transcriptional regulator AlpA